MKNKHSIKNILHKTLFISQNLRTQRLVLSAFLFVIIFSILAMTVIPARLSLDVGQASPEAVYAPREFIDEYTTEMRRQEEEEAVEDVYDYEPAVLDEALTSVDEFFNKLTSARRQENPEIMEDLNLTLSPTVIDALLRLDASTAREIHERVKMLVTEELEEGVKSEELLQARRRVTQEINMLPYSPEVKQALEKLVLPLIQSNKYFDPEATLAKQEEAREAVEPVVVPKGSLILDRGERVMEKHLVQLEALGLLQGAHLDYRGYVGLALLLLILFFIVGIYIYIFVKDLYHNPVQLFLVGLIIIITLVFSIAANYFSGYLVPVAMGVILVAVLLNRRLALLINVILAILVGLITGTDFTYMFVALAGGMIAVYGVARVHRRNDLARAGLYVAAINAVTIFALFLLTIEFRFDYDFLREFSASMMFGMGNGIFSAIMAIGLLPYLESAFGLTTAVTLLELSNPNHPLLKSMLMKAPGSYHHSIVVGNLAEAAAEELNADPLLARVGAYYHDIGKIKRPYFFSENQFSGDNPHKNLSPSLSALIIRSHIKDGCEMAKNAKLPKNIGDIVLQHHGTSLISFFYQKALESGRHDKITEKDFRYEGPLPQTKEAAIIMLADSVEAAVRSLSKPVAGRIEGTVRKIIKEKLNDGQLDESDLTLKDLDKIGDTFVHILAGIFHTRIEYPEKELKEEIEGSMSR